MVPNDTHPRALRVQIDLLREAGFEKRVDAALQLSEAVNDLARRAVAESMPGASDDAIRWRMAELSYGQELMDRVRRWLAARQP